MATIQLTDAAGLDATVAVALNQASGRKAGAAILTTGPKLVRTKHRTITTIASL